MHILSARTSPASLHNAAFPAGMRGHQRLRGRPQTTRTSQYSRTHTLHNFVVMAFFYFRITSGHIHRIKRFSFYFLHDMRSYKISPISNGCSQIGNLQRRSRNLSLTDCNTDDGQTIPRTAICLVIILCVRDHTTLFTRQVNTQLITESHRYHIIAPCIHGFLHGTIFLTGSNHMKQSPAEISVTRSSDSRYQSQRRRMRVTTDMKSPVRKSSATRIHCTRSNDTLLQKGQGLSGLKRRSRWIRSHDCTVQQRLPRIFRQLDVILASATANHQTGIV